MQVRQEVQQTSSTPRPAAPDRLRTQPPPWPDLTQAATPTQRLTLGFLFGQLRRYGVLIAVLALIGGALGWVQYMRTPVSFVAMATIAPAGFEDEAPVDARSILFGQDRGNSAFSQFLVILKTPVMAEHILSSPTLRESFQPSARRKAAEAAAAAAAGLPPPDASDDGSDNIGLVKRVRRQLLSWRGYERQEAVSPMEFADYLKANVEITQLPFSRITNVSYRDPDRELVTQNLGLLLERARELIRESRLREVSGTVEFLRKRLSEESIASYRSNLFELLSQQEEKMMRVQNAQFAFLYLTEPFFDESSTSPDPLQLVGIGMFGGVAGGMMFALLAGLRHGRGRGAA